MQKVSPAVDYPFTMNIFIQLLEKRVIVRIFELCPTFFYLLDCMIVDNLDPETLHLMPYVIRGFFSISRRFLWHHLFDFGGDLRACFQLNVLVDVP